ncbi:hypothetical protein BDR26DRAFT_858279 [Obelidium mucronatum]|nr:hypothetical protein BDR26DRAFT_858279 [Obelidium mucronatum]
MTSSDSGVITKAEAAVFMAEAFELQSSLNCLQSHLTVGLNRVNRLVQLALTYGITPDTRRNDLALIPDRYKYHESLSRRVSTLGAGIDVDVVGGTALDEKPTRPNHPLHRSSLKASQSTVSNYRNKSATTADNHLSLGLKWDSNDYLAAKPDTSISIAEDAENNTAHTRRKSKAGRAFSLLSADNGAKPGSPPLMLKTVDIISGDALNSRHDGIDDMNELPTITQKDKELSQSSTLEIETCEKSQRSFQCEIQRQNRLGIVSPDFQKTPNSQTDEQKRERARELWSKVRREGVKRVSTQSSRNVKSPKNTAHAAAQQVTPFNTMSAILHWFFLCPTFDDKGRFINIRNYHTLEYRRHVFTIDGLHPMSNFSVFINFLVLAGYLGALFWLPYQTAFLERENTTAMISYWLSGFYALDTLVNLITPKKPPKTDIRVHAKRPHLQEWMMFYIWKHWPVDVITIIPWLVLIPEWHLGLPLTILCLLRTSRIPQTGARCPFVLQTYHKIENIVGIGNILVRILPVGLAVITFIHLQSCVIYYVGKLSGFPTWNTQFDHWRLYVGGIESASEEERYVWMLYQAVGNTFPMTFKPESIAEQVVTLLFIVLGAVLYATFVGLISSAAISYDASGRNYRQKIDELTEYLTWKNIDQITQRKLLSYYELKYRGKYFEEKNLLADMNDSLRMELSSINCKQLIEKVPFLKREMNDGRDNIYLGKIATALNPLYFIPGDCIVNQGRASERNVSILVNGNMVSSISDGSFFGEVALIANIPRTASVIAETDCHLYSLSSLDFNAIILEFDDMKQRIDQIYEERMAKVRMEQAAQILMRAFDP